MIINGKAYSWADIDVNFGDLYLEPQEITYDDELEKELIYGYGSKPRGFGRGNYKASLKMVFLRDDFNDLMDYCKEKNIDFYKLVLEKIVVSYGNEGQSIVSDTITKITPTKKTGGGKQGDKSLTVEVEWLVFGEVTTNGVKPL